MAFWNKLTIFSRDADGRPERVAAWALAITYAVAWFVTVPSCGMTWDEGFYYPTFRDAAMWMVQGLGDPIGALSGQGIRFGWERIHELPPVTKWLGAFFYLIAPVGSHLLSIRLFSFVLFGMTIALTVETAKRFAPLPWAVLCGATLLLHPQLFGHAHVAASETPFLFLTALVIFIATGELRTWKGRVALAVVLGLALATKVNGLILLVGVACWLVSKHWLCVRAEGARWRDDLLTLLVILIVAPVVTLAVWPWMWDETAARLHEYYVFFTQHIHFGVWYLGEKWVLPPGNQLPVPWHYPLVMTAVGSPVIYLILVFTGIAASVRLTIRQRRFAAFDLLMIPLIVGPFAAAMLPGAPRYDGLRLFLPAFVPLTLLVARIGEWLPTDCAARWRGPAIVAAALAATTVPFLAGGLSYYNLPTMLLAPRGAEFPFERTYWMDAVTPEVFEEIDLLLGPGEIRVRPMSMNSAVLQIQREWGDIPPNITFPPDPPYDAHLIQNRKGFWAGSEWAIHNNREPLATWPKQTSNPKLYLFDGRPPDAP